MLVLFNGICHFLTIGDKGKRQSIVFKEGGCVPLWGELPLRLLELLMWVWSCCGVAAIGGIGTLVVLLVVFSMWLWWDGWALVACSEEGELVWAMPVLYGVCSHRLFPLWTANHSVHNPTTRSDIGVFATMSFIHHTPLDIAYTCMHRWGVICVLSIYVMLGGYVELSTKAHIMFQHKMSFLPACSVLRMWLSLCLGLYYHLTVITLIWHKQHTCNLS